MSAATRYYIHDLSPFAIRFSETIGIRWYGLAYIAGLLGAGLILALYARQKRSHLPAAKVSDLIVALTIAVMVGGRLGEFLLYKPGDLLKDPLSFFRVWEGGMASHGGFIAVALAGLWFARKEKIPYAHLGDLIASVTPIGLFFGRLANFVNGELWGKTFVQQPPPPWAMIFPASEPGTPVHLIEPRHPSQLYEAALEGFVLFFYLQFRFWRSDVTRQKPGQLCGEFLIGYAIARAICELYREGDGEPIMGLSRGTFYSLFLVAGGLAFILNARRSRPGA